MEEQAPKLQNIAFLKDMSDIVRARILFFVPFFIAFVTFLLNRRDYLEQSSSAIDTILGVTLFVSMFYASQLIQTIWLIEHARLLLGVQIATDGGLIKVLTTSEVEAVRAVLGTVPNAFRFEARLFRWTMYLFYFDLSIVLMDIYFRDAINGVIRTAVVAIIMFFRQH